METNNIYNKSNNINNTNNKKFNLALIQMKAIKDKAHNLARAAQFIEAAVKLHNANIVILPEFFNTPLGLKPEEFKTFVESEEDSKTISFLSSIAKQYSIYLIGGSIPVYFNNDSSKVYNTTFCFDKFNEKKSRFSKNSFIRCRYSRKNNLSRVKKDNCWK